MVLPAPVGLARSKSVRTSPSSWRALPMSKKYPSCGSRKRARRGIRLRSALLRPPSQTLSTSRPVLSATGLRPQQLLRRRVLQRSHSRARGPMGVMLTLMLSRLSWVLANW
eukprot:Rmarinus@m.12443